MTNAAETTTRKTSLAELIPGGAGRHLTALQAKALLATRRELAVELVAEVQAGGCARPRRRRQL